MTREQTKAWVWTIIVILTLWGLAAPTVAYWRGMKAGFKKGAWFAGEEWKRDARNAASGIGKATVGTAVAVMDGVSSAGVSLVSGTTRLASGLTTRTAVLMSGVGASLTSATAAAGEYAGAAGSYAGELGGDLKEQATSRTRQLMSGVGATYTSASAAAGHYTGVAAEYADQMGGHLKKASSKTKELMSGIETSYTSATAATEHYTDVAADYAGSLGAELKGEAARAKSAARWAKAATVYEGKRIAAGLISRTVPKPQLQSLGQKFELGGYKYAIDGWTTATSISPGLLNQDSGLGAVFLIVSYSIEPVGSTPERGPSHQLYLIDAQGQKYPTFKLGGALLTESQSETTTTEKSVFKVPLQVVQTSGLKLVIPENKFWRPKKVDVPLF